MCHIHLFKQVYPSINRIVGIQQFRKETGSMSQICTGSDGRTDGQTDRPSDPWTDCQTHEVKGTIRVQKESHRVWLACRSLTWLTGTDMPKQNVAQESKEANTHL
ncbi:hypothetical protein AMECASPLE_022624 [Ameca splendens]|uniref:Uncharacterized protein n=1 Tax=Ameca splendens TaxID=208324 RepID=A0ABV0ZDQ2_9TELE